jgi:hypothetical protein
MLMIDFHTIADAFFINVFNDQDFAEVNLAGVSFETPVLVLLPSDARTLAGTRLLIRKMGEFEYAVAVL